MTTIDLKFAWRIEYPDLNPPEAVVDKDKGNIPSTEKHEGAQEEEQGTDSLKTTSRREDVESLEMSASSADESIPANETFIAEKGIEKRKKSAGFGCRGNRAFRLTINY